MAKAGKPPPSLAYQSFLGGSPCASSSACKLVSIHATTFLTYFLCNFNAMERKRWSRCPLAPRPCGAWKCEAKIQRHERRSARMPLDGMDARGLPCRDPLITVVSFPVAVFHDGEAPFCTILEHKSWFQMVLMHRRCRHTAPTLSVYMLHEDLVW